MRHMILLSLALLTFGAFGQAPPGHIWVEAQYQNGVFVPGHWAPTTAPPGTVGRYGSPSFLQSPNNSAGVGAYGGSPLYAPAPVVFPTIAPQQWTAEERARWEAQRAKEKQRIAAERQESKAYWEAKRVEREKRKAEKEGRR